MDFIEHTINWCKGEIFEGKVILVFAIIILGCSFLLKKIGTTPNASALILPMLLVGALMLGTAAYLILSNKNRIEVYQQRYAENPEAFVESEKQRTAAFIKGYPLTMRIAGIVVVAGVLCYLFWGGTWGRTIGLTAILLGTAILVIDHFSEERALNYEQHIIEALDEKLT